VREEAGVMCRNEITKVILLVLTVGPVWAGCRAEGFEPPSNKTEKPDPVQEVLNQLRHKTEKLESYQADVEYLFIQPEPFDSTRLTRGVMYYQKVGNKSNLRMNFHTLKQDDEKQQKYIEHIIFDGVWLTQIDHQIKHVNRIQQAEPNEPVNAFELARRNFPIVGFTKIEELKKEFEIKSVDTPEKGPAELIHLHLKVKPDSIYKDDYTAIDFWVDEKSGLPAKIVAVTTEDDIYQIKLLKPKVNRKIDRKVFDFKIPKGFTVKETPLKKTGSRQEPKHPVERKAINR
jgi:outer membrane lipoprotein-sorting protein